MPGKDDLADIYAQRRELEVTERQVEAEAFDVLLTRPLYFGLKLIFGIRHTAPETGEPEATELMQA